jgi:hypothetical protein
MGFRLVRWFSASAVTYLLILLIGSPRSFGQATPPAKLLVKNALILTMAPGQREPVQGYLTVGEDGRLLAVAVGDPPAGLRAREVWDAGGRWVLAGVHLGA